MTKRKGPHLVLAPLDEARQFADELRPLWPAFPLTKAAAVQRAAVEQFPRLERCIAAVEMAAPNKSDDARRAALCLAEAARVLAKVVRAGDDADGRDLATAAYLLGQANAFAFVRLWKAPSQGGRPEGSGDSIAGFIRDEAESHRELSHAEIASRLTERLRPADPIEPDYVRKVLARAKRKAGQN